MTKVFTVLALLVTTTVVGQPRARGEPTAGLQAIVDVADETSQDVFPITLELCNVSEQDVPVDAWVGNWFVEVTDASGRKMPHSRAMDYIRPLPVLRVFKAGECWKTELIALRLVAHLPKSTPMWEYKTLPAGTYRVRSEFEAHATKSGLGWSGKAVSGAAQVHVR